MGMAVAANGGQGGGAAAVDAVAAREFVAQFHPNAEEVRKLPDAAVLEYHGRIKPLMDTHVANALKERGDWAPDWRQKFAGDSPDDLKTLERMQTPGDVWNSYKNLRTKVSSGELKATAPFPKDGTDEQKSAWRTEQGVPGKPEEYKLELPQGVVIGEQDKPYVDGFLKYAHEHNMAPTTVNQAMGWWAEQRAARAEQAAAFTAETKKTTEDMLRTEWGEEYRVTMNGIEGVLDSYLPKGSELKGKLITTVETSPDFARFMANIARQFNPASVLSTGGAEGQVKTITEFLTKADQMMRTDRKAYNNSEYSRDYQKYAKAFQTHTGKEWGKA